MEICVFSKFKEELQEKRFGDLKEKGIINGKWICYSKEKIIIKKKIPRKIFL